MDHNEFEFLEDFICPLREFLNQTGIDFHDVESTGEFLTFNEEYYFPPQHVVTYEKKLIKSSIIWDIIEERNKKAKESQQMQDADLEREKFQYKRRYGDLNIEEERDYQKMKGKTRHS